MAFYIKVTKQVADKMNLTAIRNKTADGNVLLWQADLNRIEGDTIFDRATRVGGVALTPQAARLETDGTENPVEVTTPDEYKDDEPTILPEFPEDTSTVLSETGDSTITEEGGSDE